MTEVSRLQPPEPYTGPCRECGQLNFPGHFGADLCPTCRAELDKPERVLEGVQKALEEYLHRMHGVFSTGKYAAEFMEFLGKRGYSVTRTRE